MQCSKRYGHSLARWDRTRWLGNSVCPDLARPARYLDRETSLSTLGDTMKVEPFALVTNSALNASKAKVRDARSYVENMLTSASDVVIVSGYYGEDFIRTILSATKGTAKKRILKFVFAGLPDVAREEQVENLIRLRGDIVKATRCAQKNIDILLSLDIRFLHAKVFRFRSKNKPPMYLIGSANFSNSAFAQNDEAMVVIKGVHPGLQDYI